MSTPPALREPTPYSALPSEPPDAAPDVRRCANCGTPAGDAFCPRCGQEQHDLHRSVRSLFAEVLDSLAGWDGKIPTTLWLLVRHPGRLTTEFLAGRRARYLRPLRLYLTLSLVYFLTLSIDWSSDGRSLNVMTSSPADPAAVRDSLAGARADSLATARARRARRRTRATADTATLGGRVERAFEERAERLRRMPEAERNRAFSSAFFGQMPNMVFALVPLFALLLRVAYRRSPLFYAEHFVHALHLHAAGFLLMSCVHYLRGTWAVALFLWLPAYVLISLRRVYGETGLRAAVKLAFVFGGYTVSLTLAVSAMAVLVIFFFVGS